MEEKREKLDLSIKTGLIDSSIDSAEEYRPRLIVNNYRRGTKVISFLLRELDHCDEFYFSVAFVTSGGLNLLLDKLKELERRGINGKIITTDYLNFNEPRALRQLLNFSNVEVRMFDTGNFHSKGYIFKNGDSYNLIVGSANLTQEALTKNEEWNLRVTSFENGELLQDTMREFNEVWDQSSLLTDAWINEYESIYKNTKSLTPFKMAQTFVPNEIKPNSMQQAALANLSELRKNGKNRALLISATGTGKTFLSAFDVKQFNPTKMLFLIHREQIARDAMASFKLISGESRTMGILSGNEKSIDADFVFATMQTMSRDDVLRRFDPKHFNYIVVDEAHRAGANSYQKILNYFEPDFLLGMTATPERSDGFDIYKLFDNNIAYEIRLKKALEEDMLCPFHYFGVSEIEVDGELLGDNADFNQLTSEERVKNVIEKAEFYGSAGNRTKGLIFCSRNDEAEKLSNLFNEHGYRTVALSGADSQAQRENAVARLERDERDESSLDYIFTVDIFNEGVDIPDINQIIMLRPTESAIIFVQQMGRGLRKAKDKDYVVIIDFIGNYQKNFWIPIALSGDRSMNSDTLRQYVLDGTSIIPGCSTIYFDRISQKRIYDSIDSGGFKRMKYYRECYENLKNKVGRTPTLVDFFDFGEIDPYLFITMPNSGGSYCDFVHKVDDDYKTMIDENSLKMLRMLSVELADGKRPYEIAILRMLLSHEILDIDDIENDLMKIGIKKSPYGLESAFSILSGTFFSSNNRRKYGDDCKAVDVAPMSLLRTEYFGECLKNNDFRAMLKDLLDFSWKKYKDSYSEPYKDTDLCLYKKYTRRDFCKMFGWREGDSSTIYGYTIKNGLCCIFVDYDKDENLADNIKYEDQFVDTDTFSWMTRHDRTLSSNEISPLVHFDPNDTTVHIFVRKKTSEKDGYYYLGEAVPVKAQQTTIKSGSDKNAPIVNILFKMDTPVRGDIYDFFTN